MKEFSKYVGLDVHKETIAVSMAEAGGGEARYFGEIGYQRFCVDFNSSHECASASCRNDCAQPRPQFGVGCSEGLGRIRDFLASGQRNASTNPRAGKPVRPCPGRSAQQVAYLGLFQRPLPLIRRSYRRHPP